MVVRDAADLIGPVIRNTLALGVERVHVLDNGSTDGTPRVLRRLARRLPVRWSSDTGPFRQAAMTNALLAEAFAAGADWAIPIDADEFWWCERGLHDVLENTDAGALYCPFLHFLQSADVHRTSPAGLLTMTRRPLAHEADPDPAGLVERGEASVAQIATLRKVIVRAGDGAGVTEGNHDVVNPAGPIAPADDVVVLHAKLRSREALHARAARPLPPPPPPDRPLNHWHVRRWHALAAQGDAALEREWRANAYGPDGTIIVGGRVHATIEDDRLARAAAPWVRRRRRPFSR
jgi:hypothetical protein